MKIFNFHDSIFKRANYRPYYHGTWEHLRMETFRLLPFQYVKSGGENFQIYHVKDSVETEITNYFDGDNMITGWTMNGTGSLVPCDHVIYSFIPDTDDYAESNAMGLSDGDKIHFSIFGTFPSGNIKYSLYYGSDYLTSVTGTEEEFTYEIQTTGSYTIRIYDIGAATSDITSGTPKCSITTLDVHGNYVSYNGGELYDLVPRGRCYFRIPDGNGLYSDDCDIDCVNNLLTGWPTFYSNSGGTPDHFIKSGKDVTRFFGEAGKVQSPLSNYIDLMNGEVLYLVFKQVSYVYWDNSLTNAPICYFKYTDGTVLTGTFESGQNPVSANREGNALYSKVTATKTGRGQLYITPTGNTDISIIYPDIYKSYSDKCIKIEISSSYDHYNIYYKGGFTQRIYKEATITRSPRAKITVIGDEKNGVIIKEKITSATTFVMRIKVTESEFEGMVESVGATWSVTDQHGRVYSCSNVEISDPQWSQGNGICEITFDSNITNFSYNNTDL